MQSEGCSESIERTSTYNCHLETWNPREIHEGEGLTGREEESSHGGISGVEAGSSMQQETEGLEKKQGSRGV